MAGGLRVTWQRASLAAWDVVSWILENRKPENPVTKVEIVTVDGKTAMEFEKGDLGNSGRMQLQIKRLAAGTYILRITMRDGNAQTTRFIRN